MDVMAKDSLDTWLKKFEADLKNEIIENRWFESYINDVICRPGPIYKTHSSSKAKVTMNWMEPEKTYVLSQKMIIPPSIEIHKRADWKSFYLHNAIMIKVVASLGREVLDKENKFVLDTLLKDIPEVEINSWDYNELKPAIECIQSNKNYADTLLVNKDVMKILKKDKKFSPRIKFSQDFIKEKGRGFWGILGQLSMYVVGLPKDIGILYDKKSSRLWMTPIKLGFNSYVTPLDFEIFEELYAWIEDEGAAVKIFQT